MKLRRVFWVWLSVIFFTGAICLFSTLLGVALSFLATEQVLLSVAMFLFLSFYATALAVFFENLFWFFVNKIKGE